tara:strand:+ start:5113 stop:6063 length:951 start_codon:yes stop_codon:yes gene_type:complete
MNPNFEMIETNGVTLRTVVEGSGPLVILLHGFPQCWYLWRHQIEPIAQAGFRVAVPDQRGYGGSTCPPEVRDYNILELTADIVGLASALDSEEFYLIGHDFGCIAAWNIALIYRKECKAVMGLSVPGWRVDPRIINPPGMEDRYWYIREFQTLEKPEELFERDLRETLAGLYFSLSADAPKAAFMKQLEHKKDAELSDIFPAPQKLPHWLTSEDLDYYVDQYKKSGFRGPINWYRNIPANKDLTPELKGSRFVQPAAFAAGSEDAALQFDSNWQSRFEASFDDLRFLEILPGAGHWLPMEKPRETTNLILRFLLNL